METLKKVLLVNALSSGATGILLAVMPAPIAHVFEAGRSWPFLVTGIFLVLFAAFVLFTFFKKVVDARRVKTIIVLDTLWVIGSLIIVVPALFNLSSIGYILITAVAVWVGAMAYLQHTGLKRMQAIH